MPTAAATPSSSYADGGDDAKKHAIAVATATVVVAEAAVAAAQAAAAVLRLTNSGRCNSTTADDDNSSRCNNGVLQAQVSRGEKELSAAAVVIQSHFRGYLEFPQASAYQNKCIENWDDICTLFASDRATGDGAEQHEESAVAMDTESEGVSTSETSSGGSKKRLKRDRLVDAVSSFTKFFKEYVSRSQGPTKPSSKEIYEVVSSVLGILRHQVLKAVKRFMNGTTDEFEMLKNLPEEEKLD